MVKSKLKPLGAVVLNRNNCQKSFSRSSNFADNMELPEEDSWVVVKKQKVTILIPRLPCSEKCISPNLDLSDGQLLVDIPSNVTSAQPHVPPQKSPEVCVAEENNGSMFLSPDLNSQSGREVHTPEDTVGAIVKPVLRIRCVEDQIGALGPLCRKKRSILKVHRMSHMPRKNFEQLEHSRVSNLLSCTAVLNKMMRATNLERRIARDGGLCRWLSALGLEQFEGIFHGKNAIRLQLANLSMKKLKDMGYNAVGPRRKLIHAIECACQPHCSET